MNDIAELAWMSKNHKEKIWQFYQNNLQVLLIEYNSLTYFHIILLIKFKVVIKNYYIKIFQIIYYNVNIVTNNANIVDIKLYKNLLIFINLLVNINKLVVQYVINLI